MGASTERDEHRVVREALAGGCGRMHRGEGGRTRARRQEGRCGLFRGASRQGGGGQGGVWRGS